MFGAELGRGATEMAGKAQHARDVGPDGLGGVMTSLQVFDEALPKRGHRGSPQRTRESPEPVPERVRGEASERQARTREKREERWGSS